MRGLPEGAAELTAEVRAREPGSPRQIIDAERLREARVGEVARATGGGPAERRPPA
jgi:hypothetical protein